MSIDINLLSSFITALTLNNSSSAMQSAKNENDWMDQEAKEDWDYISSYKNGVVAGFLSIGKKNGWNSEEGNTFETGFRFVRYMLRKFWQKASTQLSDYRDIIEPSIQSFSPNALKNANGTYPRQIVDTHVTGWSGHAIARLIGNVCKEYRANGPFFEVLINSARDQNSSLCNPFAAIIFENAKIANDRYQTLWQLKTHCEAVATTFFYSSKLTSPSKFIQNYKTQQGKPPGPNSMKILDGLQMMTMKKMKAQTIGNCWMKQPKRLVLVCFYLEALSQRQELNHDQAWVVAKKLYSKWKKSTYEEIEKLMITKGICLDLVPLANAKIDHLKKK